MPLSRLKILGENLGDISEKLGDIFFQPSGHTAQILRLTDLHNFRLASKELENNMRFFSSLEAVSEQTTSVFALVALQSYFYGKKLRRGSSCSVTVSNLFKFGCHCGFLRRAPLSLF
jgi:hypothetical protein